MRTLGREVISTRQEKLAVLAQSEPKLELTTLAHHIDLVWLREAYRRTRKDGAAGVDGVTAAQYEADLEANLSGLLERFKSGRYRAPAVRRIHLPKPGTKKTRPIGIPTLEDEVLQRAVPMTRRWSLSGKRTRDGCWRCLRSDSRSTGCTCIRRRPGWWTFVVRRAEVEAARQASVVSELLGLSHFLGALPGRGAGWCNAGRRTDRFTRALREIGRWCRAHRHWRVAEQQAMLRRKLQGHYAYYGITGNARALARFLYEVRRLWRKWLNRRSWHAGMSWDKFAQLTVRYPLPPPRVVHSLYRQVATS